MKVQERDSGPGHYHTIVDRTDECYPEYPPLYSLLPAYTSPTNSLLKYNDPGCAASQIESLLKDNSGIGDNTKTSPDVKSFEAEDVEDLDGVHVVEATDAADGDGDGGDRKDDDKSNDNGGDSNNSVIKQQVRHLNRQHRQCCTFPSEEQACEMYFDLIHRSAWFNEDKICPICLDSITPNEEILTHKCKADFHEDCLSTWLAGRVPQYNVDGTLVRPCSCPNCRGEILPRDWLPWYEGQIERRGRSMDRLAANVTLLVETSRQKDLGIEIALDRLRRANEEKVDLELDLKFERRDHHELKKRFENMVKLLNSAYRRDLLQVNTTNGAETEGNDDFGYAEDDFEDEDYYSEDD